MLFLLLTLAAASDAANMLFFSLGDWGGVSDTHPTSKIELANAQGMATAAKDFFGVDPSFVMLPGDNFYGSGIHGDAHSKRFEETFEGVFSQPELQDCPFYLVAGNHDHLGNVSAEIAYSSLSKRWNMPSMYYDFTKTAPDGATTQVVYIDTVIFAGMSSEDVDAEAGVLRPWPEAQHLRGAQLEWLEKTLSASTADYLWVSGHYPIYSQCQHGPTKQLIDDVLPLMKKYRATGYIAGHDHCSGHFEDAGMQFVLAGAGKECCYRPDHLHSSLNPKDGPLFRLDSESRHGLPGGGFASYTVNRTATTVRHHAGGDGSVLYTAAPLAPRSSSRA